VAAAHSKNTPQLCCINVGHSNQPSAMSLLTATNNASTSEASRREVRGNSGLSDKDEPSQKKLSQTSTFAKAKKT
jgi:hypothetical protein